MSLLWLRIPLCSFRPGHDADVHTTARYDLQSCAGGTGKYSPRLVHVDACGVACCDILQEASMYVVHDEATV